MSDVNEEMKSTAYFAIKSAKDRYGQNLDFSEQSIAKLEYLLEQIYWGFSGQTRDEGEGGLIFNTAIIWGSYLGEYMRLKWGGTWISKGSNRIVSINNIEFSPISLVYQKITSHPAYSVENYLIKIHRKIYTSAINPEQSGYLSENTSQPIKQIPIKQSKKPVTIDKHLFFTLAGIGGILLIIVACIFGYSIIKTGGISAFGLIASATSPSINNTIEKTLVTAIPYSTSTQNPTPTLVPTYTPNPTITPQLSHTPYLTYTPIATLTPTETQTPFIPTPTQTRTRTPTAVPYNPTNTRIPPTHPPQPTATQLPPTATKLPPTATEPPPVIIESCEIDPSTVPAGYNVTITFIVHFSSPGYGFEAVLHPEYPGGSGCSGIDDNGDGIASCDGWSGLLPSSTTINVTFSSPVGDCVASYGSP